MQSQVRLFVLSIIISLSFSLGINASWNSTGGSVPDAAWSGDTQQYTGNTNVGALAGEGGVSGGAATYTIPIVVPPGRNGVQPNVSLNYSSRSGNGIAGVGWGLSAGSSIHRCSATEAQDSISKSVTYATTDKLCLDGQRLIKVAGTYGVSGAEYRTELESFTKVQQFGSINSGSSYFIATSKDGSKRTYGGGTTSRQRPLGATAIMTWAIHKMADVSGNNTMTYTYTSPGNGVHLLDAIFYTGGATTSGNRSVKFIYETRPDISSSYLAGGLTKQTKRLSKIQTQYGSTTIREYRLYYATTSSATQRSLLSSAQECGYEGTTPHCLPATNFTWNNATVTHANGAVLSQFGTLNPYDSVSYADLNGDGIQEVIAFEKKDNSPLWSERRARIYFMKEDNQIDTSISNNPVLIEDASLLALGDSVDIDLDGVNEMVHFTNTGLDMIRLNANNQLVFSGGITINWGGTLAAQNSYRDPSTLADMNNDGYVDLLKEIVVNGSRYVTLYLHNGNATNPGFTRHSYVVQLQTEGGYTALTQGNYPTNGDWEVFSVSDMNGDGLLDIVLDYTNQQNQTITKRLLTANLSTSSLSYSAPVNFSSLGLPTNTFYHQGSFADINGDGLPDYVFVSGSAGAGDTFYGGDGGGGTQPPVCGPSGCIIPNSTNPELNLSYDASNQDAGSTQQANGNGPENGNNNGNSNGSEPDTNLGPVRLNRSTLRSLQSSLDDITQASGSAHSAFSLSTQSSSSVPAGAWYVQLNKGNGSFKPAQSLGTSVGTHIWNGYATFSGTSAGSNNVIYTQYTKAQAIFGSMVFADINADGKSEILVATNTTDTACMGKYTGTDQSEITVCNDDLHRVVKQNVPAQQSGNYELMSPKDRRRYNWSLIQFKENSNGSFNATVTPNYLKAQLQGSMYGGVQAHDTNGDGYPELNYRIGPNGYCIDYRNGGYCGTTPTDNFEIYSRSQAAPAANEGFYVKTHQSYAIDTLKTATDALANTVEWDYSNLSRSAGRSANDIKFYQVPDIGQRYVSNDPGSRHFYFSSSMLAVAQIRKSNGIGGLNNTNYSYREAVYNRQGRGIQGFRSIIVDDEASGLRSVSDFHQKFPLSGKLEATRSCLISANDPECDNSGKAINKNLYTWDLWRDGVRRQTISTVGTNFSSQVLEGSTASTRYWIAPKTQTEIQYKTNSAHGQALTTSTTELNRKIQTYTFDQYGNNLTSSSVYHEPSNRNRNESLTTNVYHAANTSTWWLNKLNYSTVLTKTVGIRYDSAAVESGSDHQKQVKTTYTFNTTHRKPNLVTTVATQGSGRPTKVTTNYNTYGLPTSVKVEGSAYNSNSYNLADRTTTTTYSDNGTTASSAGYFLYTVTNAKGHITTTQTDPKYGTPTRVTDPNGQVATTTYDAYGRVK